MESPDAAVLEESVEMPTEDCDLGTQLDATALEAGPPSDDRPEIDVSSMEQEEEIALPERKRQRSAAAPPREKKTFAFPLVSPF